MESSSQKFAAAILAVFVLLVSPTYARADSDGAFCIGPSYMAYEAYGIYLPAKAHELTIIFVGGAEGIAEPVTVKIGEFQVHGMRCTADRIEFPGGYAVDISNRKAPKYLGKAASSSDQDMKARSLMTAGVHKIPSSDSKNQYLLAISEIEDNQVSDGGGLILHFLSATVYQINRGGDMIKQLSIVDGYRMETVH